MKTRGDVGDDIGIRLRVQPPRGGHGQTRGHSGPPRLNGRQPVEDWLWQHGDLRYFAPAGPLIEDIKRKEFLGIRDLGIGELYRPRRRGSRGRLLCRRQAVHEVPLRRPGTEVLRRR